jgi:hypothetical protein
MKGSGKAHSDRVDAFFEANLPEGGGGGGEGLKMPWYK